MEDLDLKINYIIGKKGKYELAKILNISYLKLVKILNNYDILTINQLNIINTQYEELRNE